MFRVIFFTTNFFLVRFVSSSLSLSIHVTVCIGGIVSPFVCRASTNMYIGRRKYTQALLAIPFYIMSFWVSNGISKPNRVYTRKTSLPTVMYSRRLYTKRAMQKKVIAFFSLVGVIIITYHCVVVAAYN